MMKDQEVLDRLLTKGSVFITNRCNEEREYGTSKFSDGDIIVSSSDGKTFTVEGLSTGYTRTFAAKSKKNKTVTCP